MKTCHICLSLTNFTKNNTFQVYPCCCKWQNFHPFYGWVIFHSIMSFPNSDHFISSLLMVCTHAQSCLTLSPHGLCPQDFPGKNIEVSCHSLLQENFWAQGLNLCLLCLLHCWQFFFFTAGPPGKPLLFDWMPFISFSCLIALARISKVLLKRSDGSRCGWWSVLTCC